MKTISYIIVLLVLTLDAISPNVCFLKEDRLYTYILEKTNSVEIADKYYLSITTQCKKNALDPMLIAKQINKESRFRWWVDNKKTKKREIAVGPMQIKPYYWGDRLYRIKEIQKKLLESSNQFQSQVKYLKSIEYGVRIGCEIMSIYSKQYDDYRIALIAFYCGQYSSEMEMSKTNNQFLLTNHYVRSIFN